ncbi:hypothetical protein DVH24_032728 [Malus domestica]|uniref:non-specific serine/threonine protein kinase n=1 Tax=Malus domestica TaxID=3750 RepID=A0A498JAH3_MALDO|nr:hypothetical protein DVH24_032728 [Malus domestica]
MAGTGIHPYHQQWQPAAAAPPPPPPAVGSIAPPPPHHLVDNPNRPLTDEVRTIFITGLPEDVKEREIQNLLRWLPGYEASQVNNKGEKPMSFALFSTAHQAIAAKDALQGMIFDSESKAVLHTEMAKKNLFVKRGIVGDTSPYDQSKRLRTGGDYSQAGYSSPSPFHPPPPPVWGPHGYMAPPPPTYDPYGGYPVPPVQMHPPPPVPAPSSYVPVLNTKDNPPCNTLFIGNLGETINEEELRGLFSSQPGFKQMKILRQERHTVCFIEFEDVNSATNVHHALQGAVIPSSGSDGFLFCVLYDPMLSQIDQNPFGKRKDGNHPGAVPAANGAPPAMTYQIFQYQMTMHYSFEEVRCLQLLVCFSMQLSLSNFFFLLLFFFSVPIPLVSSLSSDGVALLSLLKHWTIVPTPISSTWNASDSNPCQWVGIQCDKSHNVVALNLTGLGISGQLGPEVASFRFLQTLSLGSNNFSGKIPTGLANCTLLEYLDLSVNGFSGEIPEPLFSISGLVYIYLYENSLNGSIPANVGNLSKLEELYLGDNQLSGVLPKSLNNLGNLVYLEVSGNHLEGRIDLGSGDCKNLFFLDLSRNQFSGGLPSSLGNCGNLTQFAAVSSNLVGTIPSSFGQLEKLELLYLPENRLSGKIPPELSKCTSLTGLHLYTNQLEGEIPSELGMLTKLQDLELFENRLTGEIPISIWKIQSLQHILLYNNSLTGELPVEMTELKQLQNISLFNNQFSGVIPQGLGINSSLVQLDFLNNNFTGTIPPNLCHGKRLRVLTMASNRLQGSIPSDVGNCSTLWRLKLEQNNLSGALPEFAENPNFDYMDISSNEISGAIPSSLGNCGNLTTINLSANKLTGAIPPELGNLAELRTLVLFQNNLVGSLPPQLSKCTKMDKFDVRSNLLNGSIPSILRSWTGLSTLILSDNSFTGGIPTFLSEFEKLSELQLGGNLFGGVIPPSIGALQSIFYALNLSNNGLTGPLPPELGKLIRLQQLDLSHNNLTGTLKAVDGMSSLTEVNVSDNNFTGPVPETLMKLLNSSPSSFMGNPYICVNYLPSCGETCAGNNSFKPCNSPPSNRKGLSKVQIAFIALGSSIFVVFVLYGLIYLFLWRKKAKHDLEISAQEGPSALLNKVLEATENLNGHYIIGRGAHGTVYKASLATDKDYAVKKLQFAGHEGTRLSMVREIQTLGSIRHRNLVRLEDFWLRKDHGLILYRYMQNGSLHDVLHEIEPQPTLEWSVRYRIALGTAYGLEYLHYDCDPPIVHRDIKPMNILLDSDMEPHIADFGIAKLLDHQSSAPTTSIAVVGTTGYIAPENAFRTAKGVESDVYSYGIVLLELITRKKALDPSFMEQTDIAGWAKSVWSSTEQIDQIVDSSLKEELLDSTTMDQVIEVLMVAFRCTEKDPKRRPTMRAVIKQLLDADSQVRSTKSEELTVEIGNRRSKLNS